MEYIIKISDVQHHQIIFKMPIKNQNEQYLNYYKLLYSDKNVHLKYLLFELQFSNMYENKQNNLFQEIYNLERMILSCLNQHIGKSLKISLYDEITQKELHHSNHRLLLKISGVWEDNTHIGLVYKLYYTMSTVKFSNMIC